MSSGQSGRVQLDALRVAQACRNRIAATAAVAEVSSRSFIRVILTIGREGVNVKTCGSRMKLNLNPSASVFLWPAVRPRRNFKYLCVVLG